MTSVAFTQIPSTVRAPFSYIEVNASNQNINAPTNKRIMMFGQRLTTGTVAANVPTLISSYSQAVAAFGQGSHLANAFYYLFANCPFVEKWACASDDNGAGVQASGTITISGTATATGTLALYLGGVSVPVSVASGDSATVIGDSIAAAIAANLDLPVTSSNSSGTVTVTYRHKGTIGNYYDMRINYRGVPGGESTPAGVTCVIVQLASGATDPVLTSTLAALPEMIFDYCCMPWQGATPLTAIDTEMNSRWNAVRMLEGHVIGAAGGTTGALSTIGNARNNPHMTIVDAGYGKPTPSYLVAAAACGQIASSASIDPARPFTGLKLEGVLPEVVANRRLLADRNTLLYDGISTCTIANDGSVLLERMVTCYQTNTYGVADGVYLDLTTPLTLAFLRQDLRNRITTKFARMKIANDGTVFGQGQAIVTPSIIKSEIIAWAQQMSMAGLVEDMPNFIANLIVIRNANDPTRVDVQLTPNLVNPLYIVAANISFVL